MRSILSICYKFLPLFLGIIFTIFLGLALVPGRLESYTNQNFYSAFVIVLVVLILYIGLSILTVCEIVKIFRKEQNRLQMSGAIGLLTLVITHLLLSFQIPAQLCFYTSNNQFDRVLIQQTFNSEDRYKTKIGVFEIDQIHVVGKFVYFVTTHFHGEFEERYGFAYLPSNLDGGEKIAFPIRHIYEKWYIFRAVTF